jgi:hypothetical protein
MHSDLVCYLYGEATAEEIGRVEEHLAGCGSCRTELEAFQRVRAHLQQWQLDELPVVRFEASPRRSFVDVVRELFSVTPIWVKAAGAAAMVVLFMAIAGIDVTVGDGGMRVRAGFLGRGAESVSPGGSESERLQALRSELISHVDKMIAENDESNRAEIRAQLVRLQDGISTMQSSELAKLETRIHQQRARLESLEREADRREGLDMTDMLFGDAGGGRSTSGGAGSD